MFKLFSTTYLYPSQNLHISLVLRGDYKRVVEMNEELKCCVHRSLCVERDFEKLDDFTQMKCCFRLFLPLNIEKSAFAHLYA